jgi:hypothetical protein
MGDYVKNFLLFCSGAEISILDRSECVTERNKYAAIGATILSTAALASLSGGYAIYTVFESIGVALLLGLLWGLIIFNLDRYIVSTLRKKAINPSMTQRERRKARAQELAHALPRLLLACFISIIITRPLELKLFEREIETRVDDYNSQLLANMVRQKDSEFPQLDQLGEGNRRLQDEVANKERETERLHELAMDEALGKEGSRTSGKFGKGIIYEQRWAAFEKAEAALNNLRRENGEKIAANDQRMAELRAERDRAVEGGRRQIADRRGLLARLEAHSYLAEHNPAIAWASWILIILFILLETAPIIAKLLSRRGPYDEIQDALEHRVYVHERKGISDLNDEANTDVSLSRQQNAGRVSAELELSRSTMASLETLASEELREARMEIARLLVEQWKQAELASLKTRGGVRGGRRGTNGFKRGQAAAAESPPPHVDDVATAQPAAVHVSLPPNN